MMNVTYPAELQVKGVSKSGGVVTFVYLLEAIEREHSDFLIELGLGRGKLKEVKAYKDTHERTEIKTDISLYDLIADKQDYLLYEGQSVFDSCEPSLFFVSKDVSWMSKEQYAEIKGVQKIKETIRKPLNTVIYQNFDKNLGIQPYVIDGAYPSRPKFPSSFRHDLFMYSPKDNDTLVTIGPEVVPGWETPNGTVYTPDPLPVLPFGLKYLPLYFEPVYRSDYAYIPRYAIVAKDFKFTRHLQPASISMLIRSGMPERPSMVRSLDWLTAGVVRIDPSLLSVWERELMDKKEAEKKRRVEEEEKKHKEAQEKRKKEEAEKKALEEKKKAEAEIDKRKKLIEEEQKNRENIKWERQCVKWSLQAILNRYFEHDHAWDLKGVWKEGNGNHYTCVEWKMVRIGDFGKIPDAIDPKNPAIVPTTPSSAPSAPVQVNKKKCNQYINVVLNKRWKDADFKDLVMDQCKESNQKEIKIANTAGLAQTGMHPKSSSSLNSHKPIQHNPPLEV